MTELDHAESSRTESPRPSVASSTVFLIVLAQPLLVLTTIEIAFWLFNCTEPSLFDRLFWAIFLASVLLPVGFVQSQPEATIYVAGLLVVLVPFARRRWLDNRQMDTGCSLGQQRMRHTSRALFPLGGGPHAQASRLAAP